MSSVLSSSRRSVRISSKSSAGPCADNSPSLVTAACILASLLLAQQCTPCQPTPSPLPCPCTGTYCLQPTPTRSSPLRSLTWRWTRQRAGSSHTVSQTSGSCLCRCMPEAHTCVLFLSAPRNRRNWLPMPHVTICDHL